MKHRTLEEIKPVAQVVAFGPNPSRAVRRERLERLAALLEQHTGPVRLLSRMEYLPESERMLLRDDRSPLTIAYQDAILRSQGLASDRLGDAMTFFDLSAREAHYLLCDCHHYSGTVTPQMMSARARSIAQRVSFGEVWENMRGTVTAWWSRA
jgi:hypothetical protein